MTSKLIVNSLAADTGVSTITFADQAKMGNAIFHSTGFTIGDSFLHSTGVNITNINATGVITATKFVGEVSVGSSITFEDNEKAYFGTGTDFSIYHNGSASYLDETGTGGLIVKTDTAFQVFNSAGSQAAFTVTPGGSVQLYHNNIIRAETTASGFQVTNGALDIVNNGGSGATLRNYSAGVFYVGNAAQGDFALYCQDNTNNSIILQANSGEKYIECNMGGSVDLYHHNDGIKLSTTVSGVSIAGVTTITGNIYADNYFGNSGLTLNNNANVSVNLTSTSTSGSSRIFFGDPDNSLVGRLVYTHNGDYMSFYTAGSEKVRINSAGRLDIASNNYTSGHADTKLRVGTESGSSQATAVIGSADQDVPALIITNWDGSATTNKNVIRFDNSGRGTYEIGGVGGSNEFGIFIDNFTTPKFTINNAGNASITDGDLAFASGHGINFASTGDGSGSMQNELLDDYEEGTWTPLVRNSSGTGTAGSGNYGYYTKVGNVVHAHATVHWTALNSGTTDTYAKVIGFPYATKNATAYRCQHILGAQVVGVQAGGAGYNISLAFDGNQSGAYILGVNSASTGGSNYTHAPTINSSGTIYGLSITYLTD